jgi:hypothetical protein
LTLRFRQYPIRGIPLSSGKVEGNPPHWGKCGAATGRALLHVHRLRILLQHALNFFDSNHAGELTCSSLDPKQDPKIHAGSISGGQVTRSSGYRNNLAIAMRALLSIPTPTHSLTKKPTFRSCPWLAPALTGADAKLEVLETAQVVESNGDPGAIRTRDPQLRRLFRESCNLPVLLRYSETLVRSGSAMRCQEMP